MKKIFVNFKNCHGIKEYKNEFDFSNRRVFAIYAPNGCMKTSFAKTFSDVVEAIESIDSIFPQRNSVRIIKDENGLEIVGDQIVVIPPYDEYFVPSKISTLLVNNDLRKEYESIHEQIVEAKDVFLDKIKVLSGTKEKLDEEIITAFSNGEVEFNQVIVGMETEIQKDDLHQFLDIPYDIVFDSKVKSLLQDSEVRREIENYITKFNQLLDESEYFMKGTFDYYNATTVAANLSKNGFFNANHTLHLRGEKERIISSQVQLEDLIKKEQEKIYQDVALKDIFSKIDKLITRNTATREFKAYIEQHEEILPLLKDIDELKRNVLKSYINKNSEEYFSFVRLIKETDDRKKIIEQKASEQKTEWENVVEIFNQRFIVPFRLIVENKSLVVLGENEVLSLGFEFSEDGEESIRVEKDNLFKVLSQGEKRAFYLLNIIFEVETRRKLQQDTLFIIDDIADSFDYRNKYAIIQYLIDIDKQPFFYQIVLTHNFDFFRTMQSRFVCYSNCLIAKRSSFGVETEQATGIKNVFILDWKKNFFTDLRKKIASIPFMRNLFEYTCGKEDLNYLRLTSLLHWKNDTLIITQNDLDIIFYNLFNISGLSLTPYTPVFTSIIDEADFCLVDAMSINLENKIILSIAIRLLTEKFIIGAINDDEFISGITSNQTVKLVERYERDFQNNSINNKIFQDVVLMTSENLHLNSFMYEPIIDMSDEHLRNLYRSVKSLT